MVVILAWIVAFAASPSVESVLKRMAQLAIPDTADYRTVTVVQIGTMTTRVASHVIQAGPERRWMEMDADGRRSRIVTNEGRSSMTDLASNKTVTLPTGGNVENPTAAMKRFLSSRWTGPVAVGGSLWRLEQDVAGDSSVISRSVVWDENAGDVRTLVQIGAKGDTTRLEFGWIHSGGHKVPSSTTIVQTIEGRSIETSTTFSDWRFPRTIPTSLFLIP